MSYLKNGREALGAITVYPHLVAGATAACNRAGTPKVLMSQCEYYYARGYPVDRIATMLKPQYDAIQSATAAKDCSTAGVPKEYNTECKGLVLQGYSAAQASAQIQTRLKAEADKRTAVEQAVIATAEKIRASPTVNATAAPQESKAMLVAGVGAAGLLLLVMMRKK